MKNYLISVVCSDATTFTNQLSAATRKEADNYRNGVADLFIHQGKSIFISRTTIYKY